VCREKFLGVSRKNLENGKIPKVLTTSAQPSQFLTLHLLEVQKNWGTSSSNPKNLQKLIKTTYFVCLKGKIALS